MITAVGVYREFEAQLARWRAHYHDHPELETQHLLLLALEREQNVTVAYREAVLARRLAQLEVPASVRGLFHRALVWIWKDEEMHTVYVRRALLQPLRSVLTARTLVQLAAGALGGWSVSVKQHRRWAEAPLACAAAGVVTQAGQLVGRVPPAVVPYLSYRSFGAFCRYNVETEGTAWLSWRRLAELAGQDAAVPRARVEDLRRGADDEDRHRRIFAIIADALTDEDRLLPGFEEARLVEEIRAVDESFLPRSKRRRRTGSEQVGSGAPVFVVETPKHVDARAELRSLLSEAGLPEIMAARTRALEVAQGQLCVAVKCSLVCGDRSGVTDPELVEALSMFLREHGAARISVLDTSALRVFDRRPLSEVALGHGFGSPHHYLIDASGEQVTHRYGRGMAAHSIARTWKDAHLRLSFAKLTPHHPVGLTLANLEGMSGATERIRFLSGGAHRTSSIMMLVDEFAPQLFLLESPRRLYASTDGLALDRLAARHAGIGDPSRSAILRDAERWIGEAPSDREAPNSGKSRIMRVLQQIPGALQALAGWTGRTSTMPQRIDRSRIA